MLFTGQLRIYTQIATEAHLTTISGHTNVLAGRGYLGIGSLLRGENRMKSSRRSDHFSVLIPDGESHTALSVLHCLSQIRGLSTYVLSSDPWARVRFSRYRTEFISRSAGSTDEEHLAAICHTLRRTEADVILPTEQRTVRLLSAHGETLSRLAAVVPVPEIASFDIAADKWLLARHLENEKIPCPATILYQNSEELEERLSAMTFPVLTKPTRGSNGRGIETFQTPSALLEFFRERVPSEELIIQSFIRGYDIDCSVLCHRGEILAYTIQKGFIEGDRRFGPPTGIEFVYDSGTHEIVSRLMTTLNWSGLAHIDLRYDQQDGQTKVLEVNPRFWASLMGSMIAGVNFPYLACLAGLKVELPEFEYRFRRFVGNEVAIRMMIQRYLLGNKPQLSFDDTAIGFMLRDPCPAVLRVCLRAYRKVMQNMRKKA